MHWKNQYEIKILTLQVGRKAQLAMEFDRLPQPTSKVELKSQLPSCEKKRKKKNYVQEQINILQTNSKLFYACT